MYSWRDERKGVVEVSAAHWYSCNASAPRAVLVEIGGFDESQPMLWGNEDVQLGCRMRDYGLGFVRLEGGLVTHLDHPRRERRPDFRESFLKCIRGEYPVIANGGMLDIGMIQE
jgi:GT2 family glycosyltransferase